MVVEKVVDKSPAARAGMMKGDVLVALWGEDVEATRDIYFAFRGNSEAEKVEFTFKRGGEQKSVSTPLEVPEAEAKPAAADEAKKGGDGSETRGAAGSGPTEPASRRSEGTSGRSRVFR
jgi:membrane-associated protease RseP (regulator of RpoE activity)